MTVQWTHSARRDLVRLHGFLDAVDPAAAHRAVRTVLTGVRQVAGHPRIGRRLTQFDPREVRRLISGEYEIRYEVREDRLVILRVWHVHEDR